MGHGSEGHLFTPNGADVAVRRSTALRERFFPSGIELIFDDASLRLHCSPPHEFGIGTADISYSWPFGCS